MARGFILSPVGRPRMVAVDDRSTAAEEPTGVDLSGRRVGIRLDHMWRSWDWIAEVWSAELSSRGAEIVTWRTGSRSGDEGARMERELVDFVADVDLAVVGLAN